MNTKALLQEQQEEWENRWNDPYQYQDANTATCYFLGALEQEYLAEEELRKRLDQTIDLRYFLESNYRKVSIPENQPIQTKVKKPSNVEPDDRGNHLMQIRSIKDNCWTTFLEIPVRELPKRFGGTRSD